MLRFLAQKFEPADLWLNLFRSIDAPVHDRKTHRAVIFSFICFLRRRNIRNFGGDPDSVTLFGISSGGVSVSAHSVSPVSKGLFHRVVAGSGVYTMPINWGKNHEKKATK